MFCRKAKRVGTVAHYIGVTTWYFVVIFLAIWFNEVLQIPSLFGLPFRVIGFVLTALGLSLIGWTCWLQFGVGEGTTSFSEPTGKLVTSGPYGIVRNPMMYGQFVVFAGVGFFLDLGAMFVVLPLAILAMHGVIVWVEEPSLKRRFGEEWVRYAQRVPRWIPRFGKTPGSR